MKPITVCSLRDRGEPTPEDVLCTRPGRFGNPYRAEKYGWRALHLYRVELRCIVLGAGSALRVDLADLRALAGKRLLCACPSDALACHAWILAEVIAELTGCGVIPAPGRQRS